MKNVITNKQGYCPYCDSKNIDYTESETNFPEFYDKFTCLDCKEDYTEVYKMIYNITIGDRQIEE